MIKYLALTVVLLTACTPEKPVVLTPQPTPSHMSEVTRAIALVALLALTACGYPPVVLPQTSAPVHFTVRAK